MSLLIKASTRGRQIVEVTPASAGWAHVGFRALRLLPNEEEVFSTDARECCIVVLAGEVDVTVGAHCYRSLGSRESVFDPVAPYAVYVPPGKGVSIRAAGNAELGLCFAPAAGRYAARVIEPMSMQRSVRGQGSNARHVCDILPEGDPAESLLVVEVVTPAGHSSSYPPHKHDTAGPEETQLEETYYHRLNPPQGFAFQRVYTDDRSLDEAMAVEDHDVVMVPRGYHPCVAPHGYDLYYLNTMAGPRRGWAFRNDPRHEWILRARA